MKAFHVWELWAVSKGMRVHLKTFSCSEGVAEDDAVTFSEGFPYPEIHLRKAGMFVVAFQNGELMQRGGVR